MVTLRNLTKEEKKRYNLIRRIFPATSKESAIDYAINPPRFQFICK